MATQRAETSQLNAIKYGDLSGEQNQSSSCTQQQGWTSTVSNLLQHLLTVVQCSKLSRALLIIMRDKLAHAMLQEFNRPASGDGCSRESTDLLDCPYCEGFMAQPVCLPCGHSLCKSCIEKTMKQCNNIVCPTCSNPVPKTFHTDGLTSKDSSHSRRVTLLLQNVLEKLYPRQVESCKFREEGNMFANEGDFPLAIRCYDKALSTGIRDHRVLGNRSRAYLAVAEYDKALQDAEDACSIKPYWKKGHFRCATALEKLGRWLEAISAYLLCLYLGGNDQSVIVKICQLIDVHISEFTSTEKALDDQLIGQSLELSDSIDQMLTLNTVVELCMYVMRPLLGETKSEKKTDLVQMNIQDFECSLCTGLIYEAVTSSCGHSFCRSCLCRSFDHSPSCPVCRTVLTECFHTYCQKSGQMNVDKTLNSIVQLQFSQQYREKISQIEYEALKSFRVGTSESELLPIFVCTLAFPGILSPLHVFEPRYRLMIRRCIESGSRRFGMCQAAVNNSEHSFSEYGTVLFVNSVEYTPDGRSLVKAVGERRFKVVEREMVDGYHCARVKFLFDVRVIDEEEIVTLRSLQGEVYKHAKKWLSALPMPTRVLLMHTACSPLPPLEKIPECCPNGPMWVWWYNHAVPITQQRKQEMYTCLSLRERLLILREVLPVTEWMT